MSETISADEYNALAAKRKPSKYRNVTMTLDGHVFASRAEARRYGELKLMEQAGEISELQLPTRFALIVNGIRIGAYVSDFDYFDERTKRAVVEDVKSAGTRTPVYRLKRKLMKACYGIDVVEVTA